MSANQPTTKRPPLLNDAHLQIIKNGLEMCDHGEQEALKAQRAGLDMTDALAVIRDNKAKLLQLKNVYFPNV